MNDIQIFNSQRGLVRAATYCEREPQRRHGHRRIILLQGND